MSLATSLENKIRANKKVVDMTWLGEKAVGKARWWGYPNGKGDFSKITFPYQHTPDPKHSITDFPVGTVIDLTKLFPNPTEITKQGVTYEFVCWYFQDGTEPITSWTIPKYVEEDISTHCDFIAQWQVKE